MADKIIQIAVEPGNEELPATLYALTAEGKIWSVIEPDGLIADSGSVPTARWLSLPLPPLNFGAGRPRE